MKRGMKTGGQLGIGGKIAASLFLLVFGLAGLGFLAAIVWTAVAITREYSWQSEPCTILQSAIHSDDRSNYRFQVRYQYQFEGKPLIGKVYQTDYSGSEDASAADRIAHRYPVGASTLCLVNPANPTTAILSTRSFWMLAVTPLPLLFALIGFGGIWSVWRINPEKWQPQGAAAPRLLGGIFAVVGLGVVLVIVVPGVFEYFSAQSWPAVPCLVESSTLAVSHGGKGGPTYRIDILYRYDIAGKTYKSNRYDLSPGYSSGYDGKEEIVEQNGRGKRTRCYVNPADPFAAVIDRTFPWSLVMLTGLCAVFIGAGLVILTRARPRRGRIRDALPARKLTTSGVSAPKATGGPGKVLFVLLAFYLGLATRRGSQNQRVELNLAPGGNAIQLPATVGSES